MGEQGKNQLIARNEFIDFIRGIAILAVVIGHNIQYGQGGVYNAEQLYYENVIFKTIYSFHMPLLMLISGYVSNMSCKPQSLKIVLKKRFSGIIVPIFFWSMIPLIVELISQVRQNAFNIMSFPSLVLHNLWFLWAILFSSIIVVVFEKAGSVKWLLYTILFLGFFVTPDILNAHLYKYLFPFYLLGYHGKHIIETTKFRNVLDVRKRYINLLISGLLFFTMLAVFKKECYIYTSQFSCLDVVSPAKQIFNDTFRWAIGLIGCSFFCLVFNVVYDFFINYMKKFRRVVIYIGCNTLGIYVIDDLINKYLLREITYSCKPSLLIVLVETVSIMMLCCFCTELIKKNSLLKKALLGGR